MVVPCPKCLQLIRSPDTNRHLPITINPTDAKVATLTKQSTSKRFTIIAAWCVFALVITVGGFFGVGAATRDRPTLPIVERLTAVDKLLATPSFYGRDFIYISKQANTEFEKYCATISGDEIGSALHTAISTAMQLISNYEKAWSDSIGEPTDEWIRRTLIADDALKTKVFYAWYKHPSAYQQMEMPIEASPSTDIIKTYRISNFTRNYLTPMWQGEKRTEMGTISAALSQIVTNIHTMTK